MKLSWTLYSLCPICRHEGVPSTLETLQEGGLMTSRPRQQKKLVVFCVDSENQVASGVIIDVVENIEA